jgi:hypothetical protein
MSFSQDVPEETPRPDRKEWLAQRAQEFGSYGFEREGLKPRPLTFETTPILDWSNPERGTFFGASYLWTYEGRPELIGNAYGREKWLRHEFQSLSDQPLLAARAGSHVHRFQPGIQWRELAGAPRPAASHPLRLTQMRRQAERFRAMVIVRKPSEISQPLRLLKQPVYRSPETSADDVALFLFVLGTDPECALVLEAKSDKTWRYALARQTMASLQADLDGQQVLDLPGHQQPPAPDSAFLVITPPEAKAAP